METITEITVAETARRVRARDYEVALNRRDEAQRRVTTLSTAPHGDTVSRLRRIIEDAEALPATVIGSVGGLIPLSGEAKTFISALATTALASVERTDTRRQSDLNKAKAALSVAEATLTQFE